MTINQNIEKSDEWKNKFFQLTDSLDKQKEYDHLLERSLTRLALASQGLDPVLDKHLTSLRKFLRNSNNDIAGLTDILEKLEQAIGRMDEEQASAASIPELISMMLSNITWPKPYQKTAKKLQKKSHAAANNEAPEIIRDLTDLLSQCFHESHSTQSQGFLSKLFSAKTTAESAMVESSDFDDDSTTPQKPHLLLTNLLEKLSLPPQLSQQATRIRLRIQNGVNEAEIPGTINEIADLVSDLGSLAAKEKKEYESFLKDLTNKITALDQQIGQIGQDDATAFDHRRQLSNDVDQQMQGLRSEVEGATDLNNIKQALSNHLDNLNNHIASYHQADNTRFEESQQQLKTLNKRLQEMEAETAALREANKEARELAMKDSLTGIWNRQALTEVVEREFNRWTRYQQPLTMVVWDIDHFKEVNDQFGHSAGDIVLKTIARIFSQSTRNSDFVARFGGEEFVGLFPETNLDDARQMADNIRQTIAQTNFQHKGIDVPITASAGLATFETGDTIDDVFSRADKALYAAKNTGRNNCQIKYKTASEE